MKGGDGGKMQKKNDKDLQLLNYQRLNNKRKFQSKNG